MYPDSPGSPTLDAFNDARELLTNRDEILRLCPPALARDRLFQTALEAFDQFLFPYMIKTLYGETELRGYLQQLAKDLGVEKPPPLEHFPCPTTEGMQRVFARIVSDFQLDGMVVDSSHFVARTESTQNASDSICVPQIRVVDTERVPFAHILEFRKDAESIEKMRRFRLFAFEQYAGKSRAYVEDDIQKRLTDYDDVVRSWKFETALKGLTFVLNSKFLAGAFATSAISVLLGAPELAKEALATGAVVEVGRLALEFAKDRHDILKIVKENPISYIADVRKKLEAKKQ